MPLMGVASAKFGNCEIPVGGDQLATMFDRQCRNISITDQGTLDCAAQVHKKIPMRAARTNKDGSGPFDERAAKGLAL